jgi:2-polyprenyl-3-methyl-5-hydroxy-6-metoxy-1,4-benzoquinol methylase
MTESKTHWENIYRTKSPKDVSWFTPHLEKSLDLILGLNLSKDAAIIDIGGGASTLPDDLLAKDFKNITILDISAEALKTSKDRLESKAGLVHWIEADVTNVDLKPGHYDLWHDRAVFHFLTDADNRRKYVEQLKTSLKPEGHVIISTFSLKGPLKCSGLEIVRYSPQTLLSELGFEFHLVESFEEEHPTPFGTTQAFVYCLFKKVVPR